MNKRLIFILLFFFALLTPLIFNGPSKIYEVFAVDPTPFGPGPVVPPGGQGGGAGTTIPVQTPQAGKALSGWNGTSFDTVTLPTPAPTPTAVPASTPVAGQAVTGFGAGVSSVSRESFQAPLPTATPITNYVLRDWNGTSFDSSQLDYSELANPPALDFDPAGTAQALITSSTSSPSDPCTGLQGNFWRKVDSGGLLVDLYQCDCEGADNATNCVWHSNITPVTAPLAISSGSLVLDILGLTEDTTPGSDYEIVGQKVSDSTYVKIPTSAFLQAAPSIPYHKCIWVELLKATDDAITFDSGVAGGMTLTSFSCQCKGTCSTMATFTLQHGAAGTAITITDTTPACTAQGTTPTTGNNGKKALTANNTIAADEDFSFSVSNTPTGNGTDSYNLCINGTIP